MEDASTAIPLLQRQGRTVMLPRWRTVVLNDPINLMDYVTAVLMRHFGYSEEVAHGLMLRVHHEGRAVVSVGSRESAEADVLALHGYGLRAVVEEDES